MCGNPIQFNLILKKKHGELWTDRHALLPLTHALIVFVLSTFEGYNLGI
jgi:hypothetical protein